ncbi:MAG: molybdenum ABC transporter ATP-binding protein [Candidatus Poribacteria bacterium]|nr:molybdenum ABC transporter ATP-binding protein [Candidatus Poribacteria bacterium]
MLTLSFRKQLGSFQLEVDHVITEKVTAFLGPSGSGKSTLLNCISGILHPDKGEIIFVGQTLYSSQSKKRLPPEKRRFGYVFQDGHLFPHLTVQQNIFYGRPRRFADKNQIDTEVVIDILEIGGLMNRYPNQLSGGQRQRVAVARALAIHPRLLLMDEPLASLDAGLKNRILPYLYHIKQTFDIPILYVTHSISEVMALADEAFWLSDGRITAHGEPHELLASPSALPIAQMAGVENILSLPVVASSEQRGITELGLGSQKLLVSYTKIRIGETMPIAIKAQDIIVAIDPNLLISARNILRGTIRHIAAQGGRVMLSVDIEGRLFSVELTSDARNQLALAEETVCYFIIKASAINLLWEA